MDGTWPPTNDRGMVMRRTLVALILAAGLVYSVYANQNPEGQVSQASPGPTTTTRPPAASRPTQVPVTRPVQPATGLHPGLVAALERARQAAEPEGHAIPVSSGWRSVDEQNRLLAEAIEKHGSVEEATRWVFPPERSMHVRGLAIDVGDGPSADWLLVHGHRFGICHTLSWEWWHFEWRQSWEDAASCPAEARTPEEAPPPDGGW